MRLTLFSESAQSFERYARLLVYAGVQLQYPGPAGDQSAQPSGGSSPEVDLLSNESISWHQHSDEEEDLAG